MLLGNFFCQILLVWQGKNLDDSFVSLYDKYFGHVPLLFHFMKTFGLMLPLCLHDVIFPPSCMCMFSGEIFHVISTKLFWLDSLVH